MPAEPPPRPGPAVPRPRREVVTGVPRAVRRSPGHPLARSEISEQTTLGHTYVRSLMRGQLRAALGALASLAVLIGALPLLLALPAALAPGGRAPAAEPFAWAALGFGAYPLIWWIARRYVRRAERNERDFTRLLDGR